MSSTRLYGIVISASKYNDDYRVIVRTANGQRFVIKDRPPQGIRFSPPTTLSFADSGSTAQQPDGSSLPVADSPQLVTTPLSLELAPLIKGTVRRCYERPGSSYLYVDYDEEVVAPSSYRPRIYTSNLVSGSFVPVENSNILFATHSIKRNEKSYTQIHLALPDKDSMQRGRACIAPPELVSHLHSTGHDIYIGAFDEADETIADHPIFSDTDIKLALSQGSSIHKLTIDKILIALGTKYAEAERRAQSQLDAIKSSDNASAEQEQRAQTNLENAASCRRHLRDIALNKPSIAVNLTFMQKGYTGATQATCSPGEMAQWVGSFCNNSQAADSIRRVTLITPAHHQSTPELHYELHPPEESHFFLRGAANRLVSVTLTDMLHLGTYDPDAQPPQFDYTRSSRFTRLQLLEYRGGSAPQAGPHPRSPPIEEIALIDEDEVDESASAGDARDALAHALEHSIVYSVTNDKRKTMTDLSYPLLETLAGYSTPHAVSSHQYSNFDAAFTTEEEVKLALQNINDYGLGIACGMRADVFYSHQKSEDEPVVFNIVLGSLGAKGATDKLARLIPDAQFVFLTNYLVRVHSPRLSIKLVIKKLTSYHAFETTQGERLTFAALASDILPNGIHYFSRPRQTQFSQVPRALLQADRMEVPLTSPNAFLIAGAERCFSQAALRLLIAAFVPITKESPGAATYRWVSAPSGESYICVTSATEHVTAALNKNSLRFNKRLYYARPYNRSETPIEGTSLFKDNNSFVAPLTFPSIDSAALAKPKEGPDVVARYFAQVREKYQSQDQSPAEPSPSASSPPSAAAGALATTVEEEEDEIAEVEEEQDLSEEPASLQMPPPASRPARKNSDGKRVVDEGNGPLIDAPTTPNKKQRGRGVPKQPTTHRGSKPLYSFFTGGSNPSPSSAGKPSASQKKTATRTPSRKSSRQASQAQ